MRFIAVNTCDECPLVRHISVVRCECGHADTQGFAILLDKDKMPVGLMTYCPLPESVFIELVPDVLLPLINTVLESNDDNAATAVELMSELQALFSNMNKE